MGIDVPTNLTEFLIWFFDIGFDAVGVIFTIWLIVFFIPRRDTLYLDTMKEDMEDSRESIKVLHQEVTSSRVLIAEHMTEHNKTQTKLLSDCVTLMQRLVAKSEQQDSEAHTLNEHMTKQDSTQTMLMKECVDIMANLEAKMREQSDAVSR